MFLLTFNSCKKKGLNKNYTVIDTPVNTKIYKSYWFNKNIGVFCGGTKNAQGYIYTTTNGGSNWVLSHQNTNNSLYNIYFVNDSIGYCCGDNMYLLKTQNKGITWQEVNLQATYSYDAFFNGSLKGIFGNQTNLFIVGGKNFNVGIIIKLENNSVKNGFKGFSNELSCGFNFNTNHYIACGYGTGYCTTNSGADFNPTTFSGDNLTACVTLNATTGFACGYNGSVYKTTDAGAKYQKILNYNHFYKKRINFNDLSFINQTTGWVVGNQGVILETTNAKQFNKINLNTNHDLLSISLNTNNQAIISTSNGKLILFDY